MSIQLTEQQKNDVRLWCEALESGKYQQGQIYLRSLDEKYCCWGVACDIFQNKLESTWGREVSKSIYTMEGYAFSPPNSLFYLLNVDDEIPMNFLETIKEVLPVKHYYNLTAFNDGTDLTFKQIAALLRFVYLDEPLTDPEKENESSN